jgi:hypothetical protein
LAINYEKYNVLLKGFLNIKTVIYQNEFYITVAKGLLRMLLLTGDKHER